VRIDVPARQRRPPPRARDPKYEILFEPIQLGPKALRHNRASS